MSVRLVISPPKGDYYPFSEFWFEEKRDAAPAWWPARLAAWWTRWRAITGKRRLKFRSGADHGPRAMVVAFENEAEMFAMMAKLDALEDGTA